MLQKAGLLIFERQSLGPPGMQRMRATVLGQKRITPFPKTKECEQIRASETTLTARRGLWWETAGARGDQIETMPFYCQNFVFGRRDKQYVKILTHGNGLY